MEENSMNQEVRQPQNNDNFGKQLVDALLHLLYRLAYFLFILPYDLWRKAVIRLSKQKEGHSLDLVSIKTEYPFLSWFKRFFFEFLIDALTVLSWLLLLIFFIYIGGFKHTTFFSVVFSLYVIYWAPVVLAIVRDLVTILVVMPTRWIISLYRRPAKTFDLTHTGRVKKD